MNGESLIVYPAHWGDKLCERMRVHALYGVPSCYWSLNLLEAMLDKMDAMQSRIDALEKANENRIQR